MLSFSEAQQHIRNISFACAVENISITQAHNRILGEDVYAHSPVPRWNNSAMDGYTIRYADLDPAQRTQRFPIVGSIPAGCTDNIELPPNSAIRIFTGSPLPTHADTVIIQENVHTEIDNSGMSFIKFSQLPKKWENCRIAGEEIQQNACVFSKGTRLSASGIALAISAGIRTVAVYKPPTIALISTGDELQDINAPLEHGQIWCTNNISLALALQEIGCNTIDCGIAKDNLLDTIDAFQKAIDSADIIISTGGVSVGEYDVVLRALADQNATLDFWKVKMKPGKPLAVGKIAHKPFFALPGNPVSCMVSFYQFIRPCILGNMGVAHPTLRKIKGILQEDITKKGDRLEFFRVTLEHTDTGTWVQSTGNQSSAWLSSLSSAQGLLAIAENTTLHAGQEVVVELLP